MVLLRPTSVIRVLVVDVTVTLGGLIAGTGTLGTDVGGKEDALVGLGIQ